VERKHQRTNQPERASGKWQSPARSVDPGGSRFTNPFLWPLLAAASVSQASASFLNEIAQGIAHRGDRPAPPPPSWTTHNAVALELPSMRLRDFSARPNGQAVLICAPYALHGATIADFAPGHSVVEALRGTGLDRVLVTDWRSATPDLRHFSIDTYLADLNVAIDELAPPVDLVGLCQGGWMALIYAARFPAKVRRLVLAGAPIDIRAGASPLSRLAAELPLTAFETVVRMGDGRVLGRHALELWAPALGHNEADRILQVPRKTAPDLLHSLEQRFEAWYAFTVDLPGTYYLQVVRRLFRENQIAEGRFIALGRRVDLADVRVPTFLLAARDDETVAPAQLFAAARLIGTPAGEVETFTEPCGHLSLFLGARTIRGAWRRIAAWLGQDMTMARAS
jgi:poly(3-hydroxyalkanoate) synthetase